MMSRIPRTASPKEGAEPNTGSGAVPTPGGTAHPSSAAAANEAPASAVNSERRTPRPSRSDSAHPCTYRIADVAFVRHNSSCEKKCHSRAPGKAATIDPLQESQNDVLVAARRWRALWTAPTIVAGALCAVAVSFISVALLGHSLAIIDRSSVLQGSILAHAAGYALALLTGSVVVGSLVGAFRSGDRRALLRTVLTSYFGLMFVFASFYYIVAFFGDLEDALFKYDHYRADAVRHIAGPEYESRRAFAGIESRFWSGVDWPVRAGRFPDGLPPGAFRMSTTQMRDIASSHELNEVVQFLPESGPAVFGDCLHLSVVTMTTVGYGDITPKSLAARSATDIEAVCNSLLLIFGLGMIFGNLHPAAARPPDPAP
jgi:hypothetical protein